MERNLCRLDMENSFKQLEFVEIDNINVVYGEKEMIENYDIKRTFLWKY